MYAELIAEIDSFFNEVNEWRIKPNFKPTPEWFANMSCYRTMKGCIYIRHTIFDTLLWAKNKYDGNGSSKVYNEESLNETLNQLCDAFIQAHHHAEEVTDSIMSYLHQLKCQLQAGDISQVETIVSLIDEDAYEYEILNGICNEFANVIASDHKRHPEFLSGFGDFPSGQYIKTWTRQFYLMFINITEDF